MRLAYLPVGQPEWGGGGHSPANSTESSIGGICVVARKLQGDTLGSSHRGPMQLATAGISLCLSALSGY